MTGQHYGNGDTLMVTVKPGWDTDGDGDTRMGLWGPCDGAGDTRVRLGTPGWGQDTRMGTPEWGQVPWIWGAWTC